MKAPMSWLADYVDLTDVTPKQIQDILTLRGLEITSIDDVYGEISNVVVARVEKMTVHPDSDHMFICQMDVGSGEPLQIVTGAQNVSEGDWVPAALHGATLPGGVKIKKGKLRGEVSNGMLCSGEELLLQEGDYPTAGVDGIMILQGDDFVAGVDIKEFLGINEVVFEAEPTPNRPDCLSIIGIARELSAALDRELHLPEIANVGELVEDVHSNTLSIDIEAGDLCSRYMARLLNDIKIEPSPEWMQRKLKAVGLNTINNIVDITNFVMMEYGQPMHAFDFDGVEGNHIIVRRAKGEEVLTTLDEKERTLNESMLVIADEKKAIALAGVMGGENLEITDQTKTVLLESAVFDGYNVRQTAKTLGMSSDASTRFSKGLDIEGTKIALLRACQLIQDMNAGAVQGQTYDVCCADLTRRILRARVEKINQILALSLSAQEMAAILNSLFMPTIVEDQILVVEIPHFREDMEGEADVAEEVARVIGHNNIQPTLMRGDLVRGRLTKQQKQLDRIRYDLCGLGAYESITYAFTGNSEYDQMQLSQDDPLRVESVKIANPFGEDNALMRTTLVVGMLNVIATNAKRRIPDFRFFEIGYVHRKNPNPEELPTQTQMLCIACYGPQEDFYTLKGMVESLLSSLDAPASWSCTAGGDEYYHPGRKALFSIGREQIGQMGEVHPDVCSAYGIPKRAYIAEISLDALLPLCATKVKKFKSLPRYPAIDRDLALIVPVETEAGALAEMIKRNGGKYLQNVNLFDVYHGENIGLDVKSLAYSLHYQADDHTLKDEEVNQSIQEILKSVEKGFSAKIR